MVAAIAQPAAGRRRVANSPHAHSHAVRHHRRGRRPSSIARLVPVRRLPSRSPPTGSRTRFPLRARGSDALPIGSLASRALPCECAASGAACARGFAVPIAVPARAFRSFRLRLLGTSCGSEQQHRKEPWQRTGGQQQRDHGGGVPREVSAAQLFIDGRVLATTDTKSTAFRNR